MQLSAFNSVAGDESASRQGRRRLLHGQQPTPSFQRPTRGPPMAAVTGGLDGTATPRTTVFAQRHRPGLPQRAERRGKALPTSTPGRGRLGQARASRLSATAAVRRPAHDPARHPGHRLERRHVLGRRTDGAEPVAQRRERRSSPRPHLPCVSMSSRDPGNSLRIYMSAGSTTRLRGGRPKGSSGPRFWTAVLASPCQWYVATDASELGQAGDHR